MKRKAFISAAMAAAVLAAGTSATAFAAGTFRSDTNTNFSVKPGASYTFRITANGTTKSPAFAVGTAGVFTSKLAGKSGNDYFYKITAVGKSGAAAGIYVSGARVCVASISGNSATTTVACPNYARPFNVDVMRQEMIAAGEALGMVYTPSFTITNVDTETGAGDANASYRMPGDTIDYGPDEDDPTYDYTYWLHKNTIGDVTGVARLMEALDGHPAAGTRFNPIWVPKGNGEYLFYVLFG